MLLSLILIFSALFFTFWVGFLAVVSFNIRIESSGLIFFLGFSIITVVSSWLSIWLPLNNSIILLLLTCLILLTALRFKTMRQDITLIFKNLELGRTNSLFVLGFGFLLSIGMSMAIGYYDTGLYHMQNIKWIEQYPVVPGLGNLHGRFAFNSHFFLPSALFNVELEREHQSVMMYPLNASCVLALVIYLIQLLKKNISNISSVLCLSSIVLVCILYPFWINTPSPDIISAVLVVFTFFYLINGKDRSIKQFQTLILIVLCAITIKLSNAFLALVLIPFYFGLKTSLTKKEWIVSFALFLFAVAPFLIRNYYLSGYFIYPIASLDFFSVDWKIPFANVLEEKSLIKWWARLPGVQNAEELNLTFIEWLPIWWGKKSIAFKLLLLTNVLIPIALFMNTPRKKMIRMLIGILLVNSFFWFINAPDPRFIHGFLIIGTSIAVYSFCSFLPESIFSSAAYSKAIHISLGLILITSVFTVDMKLENWFIPAPVQENTLTTYKTNFKYFVPIEDTRCYNSILPCMPEMDESVLMRTKYIKHGFYRNVK